MSEDELTALRAEVRELRALVERQQQVPAAGGPVSRRRLFGALPAVAAAGITAAATGVVGAQPAAADAGGVGDFTSLTVNAGTTDDSGHEQPAEFDFGLHGGSIRGYTLFGGGGTALGVGQVSPGPAIEATLSAPDYANPGAPGSAIIASAETDHALSASNTDTATTNDAVVFSSAGLGRALLASVANARNTNAAIAAVSKGTGSAVYGAQANTTATGAAVTGVAAAKGRGGRFSGGAAAVTLVPTTAASHPATGSAGDLYVDKSYRLWFCKGGATWKQLA